jgi:hypothetical protein
VHIGHAVRSPDSSFEASVLIDGHAQPLYRRPGDGKVFVEGEAGRVYTLRVRNLLRTRIEVINTVDGRNTLKDEPGSLASKGLVFAGLADAQFAGWRLNDSAVREFEFAEPFHSVVALTGGDLANVGVIGLAAYSEYLPAVYQERLRPGGQSVAAYAGTAVLDSAVTRGGSLGTGMGERREDRVGRTTFTRHGKADVLAIGYDSGAVLADMGILGPPEPDPFPGEGTGYERFAK